MNTKSIVDWLLNRLSENSTWRGIILVITSAGVVIEPARANAIVATGLTLVGLINIIRKGPNAPDNPSTRPPI